MAPLWQNWFQIHPETKFDHATQQIATVARTDKHVDLFVIGFDNVAWSTWWEHAKEHVTLHFKSLLPLTKARADYLNDQFAAIEDLYAQGQNIDVARGTTEDLSSNAALTALQNLNVGACKMGTTTTDQDSLFQNRDNVGANDVVVYLVSSLIGGSGNFVGCAAHPAGRPGCVIVPTTARWLTGHEVGHVLDLVHVNNADRLMNPNTGWTNVPPDLVADEYQTMLDSGLTSPY
jgi:hypothetical protein